MKIVIAADHAGYELKTLLAARLEREGYTVNDLGTTSGRAVDYPDYAREAAGLVTGRRADFAVLVCGTGLGMAIAANKMRGTRAVTCNDLFSARAARCHNNANVLCLGGRILGPDLAWEITRTFLETTFGGGRHLRRLRAISRLEKAGEPKTRSRS